VAREYSGALSKIANYQVALTAKLWTGTRTWLTGALKGERMRRGVDPPLIFPAIRAIIQEIFAGSCLLTNSTIYRRIQELQTIDLPI
jgi:hypothetical protein